MVFQGKIPDETRAFVRIAKKYRGMRQSEIMERCGVSRSMVYRILKGVNTMQRSRARHKRKLAGRPRKLSGRQERLLLRQISTLREEDGNFTVKRLMERAGLNMREVSCRTVQRFLRSHGYRYLNSRKKGVLLNTDFKRRVQFAKAMRKDYNSSVWTEKIAFYVDGVSFIHKNNPYDQARAPKGKIWCRPQEGLARGCTAKGAHCGSGGRLVKFFVAISYGKGVILCEQYNSLNGRYFKTLIEREFQRMFRESQKASKLFIQDGDPSQNSALARAALKRVGAKLLAIPPRSPDLNPIENIFNIVKRILEADAIKKNISYETYEQFSERIVETFKKLDHTLIDRTIASMNKRIDAIIGNKGSRTKY